MTADDSKISLKQEEVYKIFYHKLKNFKLQFLDHLLLQRESNLFAAFELFLINKDKDEFSETVQLIIKLKYKKFYGL